MDVIVFAELSVPIVLFPILIVCNVLLSLRNICFATDLKSETRKLSNSESECTFSVGIFFLITGSSRGCAKESSDASGVRRFVKV